MSDNKMRFSLDCYPCFIKQTVIAVRLGTTDITKQESVIHEIMGVIPLIDTSKTPAHAATSMHRTIRELLGNDPFRQIKMEYTKKALDIYPRLKKRVLESKDPLWTASRLAIAGNVIDFGIFTSIDIEGTMERALTGVIAVDDYASYKDEIAQTSNILYLLDNTGEEVFDRILIETLVSMGKRVTAVAKGSPVINDCTLEDARAAGLPEVCNIIDNGSDAVGTILETTSSPFRDMFLHAELIISKGQGNFETLHNTEGRKIFFLFQSKCEVVSRLLGLPCGSMLLMKGPYK